MNGFDYFKLGLEKYGEFEGRSRRKEYWYYVLFQSLIFASVGVAEILLLQSFMFIFIGGLLFTIPSISVTVRRLHDIGKSGWNYLWSLVPVIGPIMMLIWMCTDSEKYTNAWGPNPKDEQVDLSEHLIDESPLIEEANFG